MLEGREVRKFVLNRGVTTVGRAQDNDIVINNLALSRRHAQLVYVDDGGYELSDLKSQNGVYINSERIRSGRVLSDRDTITLGTYNFIFREDEAASRAPPRRKSSTQAELDLEPEYDDEDEGDYQPEYEDDDEEAPVPLLVLTYNDVELQRFPIREDSCLVGRAKECGVQIPERRLSRKHCQIVRNEGERYFVKDLGSQNGTYVNRRRIRGFHELSPGDVLNFAEYSVTFLSDGDAYAGPDSEVSLEREESAAPVPNDPLIAGEETVMPAAYSDEFGYVDEDSAVHPVAYDEDDEPKTPAPPVSIHPKRSRPPARDIEVGEPVVERPKEARARRKGGQIRAIRETRRPADGGDRRNDEARERRRQPSPEPEVETARPRKPRRPEEPEARRRPPEAPPPKRGAKKSPPKKSRPKKPPTPMHEALEEESLDPDELDGWYASRDDKSALYEPLEADPEDEDEFDDDSGLVRREASSVSAVLSTMMVDKRELDRNLKRKKKASKRSFSVEVKHGDEVIYAGPLDDEVTILGTDREADIPLRGRYVAGRHSLLVRVRDSLLLVRLGSSSAARVNGLPKLQAFLKSGDVIQIDETTIEVTEG